MRTFNQLSEAMVTFRRVHGRYPTRITVSPQLEAHWVREIGPLLFVPGEEFVPKKTGHWRGMDWYRGDHLVGDEVEFS